LTCSCVKSASQCCLFLCVNRQPSRPSLFPYTTLFRSRSMTRRGPGGRGRGSGRHPRGCGGAGCLLRSQRRGGAGVRRMRRLLGRSEEHTSELQSRENLVCRLLLEKKKRILFFIDT